MKKVSNKICFGALTIFVLGDFAVKSESSLPTRKKKKTTVISVFIIISEKLNR